MDVESAVADLRAMLAELAKRLAECDRRWRALEAFDSYRKVQQLRQPNRLPDTGEV